MKRPSSEVQHLAQNQALSKLLATRKLKTIPDVIALMDKIHELLGQDDGIWWFNSLYRRVTLAIQADYERDKWRHPAWLMHLDVEFAQLYFQAIECWLAQSEDVPRAWTPLFNWRYDTKISPVQFALAGVNAHINRDLALAVVAACKRTKTIPKRGTPEEHDYVRINEILEEVEVEAMQEMARGVLKIVSKRVNPLDKKLAMTFIGWARDIAWNNAESYWRWTETAPNAEEAARVIKNMDRISERMGRGILFPPATVRGRALL